MPLSSSVHNTGSLAANQLQPNAVEAPVEADIRPAHSPLPVDSFTHSGGAQGPLSSLLLEMRRLADMAEAKGAAVRAAARQF
jgi:hypothetical protein